MLHHCFRFLFFHPTLFFGDSNRWSSTQADNACLPMRTTLRAYENKGRPRINCVVGKKKNNLILSPLQIHERADSEIPSSVRRAADKQRGTTSGEKKKNRDKRRLYSGYSREEGIKVQEGGDCRESVAWVFSEEENALITRLEINCVGAVNSNSGCHRFFMTRVEVHRDASNPLAAYCAAAISTPEIDFWTSAGRMQFEYFPSGTRSTRREETGGKGNFCSFAVRVSWSTQVLREPPRHVVRLLGGNPSAVRV